MTETRIEERKCMKYEDQYSYIIRAFNNEKEGKERLANIEEVIKNVKVTIQQLIGKAEEEKKFMQDANSLLRSLEPCRVKSKKKYQPKLPSIQIIKDTCISLSLYYTLLMHLPEKQRILFTPIFYQILSQHGISVIKFENSWQLINRNCMKNVQMLELPTFDYICQYLSLIKYLKYTKQCVPYIYDPFHLLVQYFNKKLLAGNSNIIIESYMTTESTNQNYKDFIKHGGYMILINPTTQLLHKYKDYILSQRNKFLSLMKSYYNPDQLLTSSNDKEKGEPTTTNELLIIISTIHQYPKDDLIIENVSEIISVISST